MRTSILLLFMLLQIVIAYPQSINIAEYYFGELDPGYGRATALLVTPSASRLEINRNLSTAGLPSGFQIFHIRVKTSKGWSGTQRRTFFIHEVSQAKKREEKIISAEYYFDDIDPGFGFGNNLNISESAQNVLLNETFELSGLSPGFHTLSVRFLQENGSWSTTTKRFFYLQDIRALAKLAVLNFQIRQNETLLSSGSIPISPQQQFIELQLDIDPRILNTGQYEFCISVVDNKGDNSPYSCRRFSVNGNTTSISPTVASQIKLYPNPSTDYVNLKVMNDNILGLQLFTLSGKKLKTTYSYTDKRTVKLHLQEVPSGIHILTIETPGKVLIKSILKN